MLIPQAGRWLVALFVLAGALAPLRAGEPVLRNVNVRGLQVGGTTTIVCDGDELGTAPRLLLPFPAKVELKKGATDKQATFDVTLAADVVPGYHHLRVATDHGVSLPVIVGVDALPQRPLAATVELPLALHGAIAGSATLETRIAGKAGQKLQIEVEAERLGSKLRPVIHLVSPRRLQVAWAWPSPTLAGDTRLEATLPEDGLYTVALHDAEYAGPVPGFFRLKLGQWSCIDQVFPPAVARGRAQAVELLGPAAPFRVDVPGAKATGALALPWPGPGTWSGARPFVEVSPHAEVVEQLARANAQDLPPGPVGVSGQLVAPYEEDRYRIPVTAGSKVRLEVFAERLGSPLDVALVVRNEAGAEVARVEDSPGTVDPLLEYTVPDKVTSLIVGVVDAQGRGGPRGTYRLVVEPQAAPGAADFRLVTTAPAVALPAGGRGIIPVLVERYGDTGSIEIAATSLPSGLKLENATIPEGADGALVTLQRGDTAVGAALTTWHGRAVSGEERTVRLKGHPLEHLQPWLATEIALAMTAAKAADFQIDWRGLPADVGLVPTKKLALPVKITRPDDNTIVKLTLLTSQRTPLVNNQPDPNQALRAENVVELPAKTNEGELTLLVPVQLSGPVYDVTVQAELLTPDKKTVKALAHAPVRRLAVRLPVIVRLDGPARVEATLDPKTGATLKLPGKIERLEGFSGDVALTLTGLPAGARADAVTVKGDTTAFTLNIVLPPTQPAAEIRGLKLAGTIAADPKQPNVRVKSRDVELTLVVKAK